MLLLKDILTFNAPLRLATLAIISILLTGGTIAQTYTKCDPIRQRSCPADPALGRAATIDFSAGASSDFTATGRPTYDSSGASFTIARSGDSPMLTSNWYIMFGRYEITMRAAPGQGIISSVVLQSDDLDEIDWEWVGSQGSQAQTNYFGKGQTTTWDRGGTSPVNNAPYEWHTYGVEWTESQITWSIDGSTVRTLTARAANGQYPQTPCQLKIGTWSGGDPSNAEGTIQWAGGPTNYAAGPYTMTVKSLSVVDYSTGSKYTYGDASGRWSSIEASGGRVNGNVGGSLTRGASPSSSAAPSGAVIPLHHSSGSANASYTSYPQVRTVSSAASIQVPSITMLTAIVSTVIVALLGSLSGLG